LLHSRSVKPGVYKVRSIAESSWNEKQCTLRGNDYTNFIEVPEWMKSFQPSQWEKLTVEKGQIQTESDSLHTKILFEKRGEKRKYTTLRDLIKKGTFFVNFKKATVKKSESCANSTKFSLHSLRP
jgi:hypothetical protein